MITVLTRQSLLDTARDLETELLCQIEEESAAMVLGMLTTYDEEDFQHPTVKMWVGYEVALAAYSVACSVELSTRGVHTSLHLSVSEIIMKLRRTESDADFEMPPWINDLDVLRSHRSNLLRRAPEHYDTAWRGTPENWPYIWPFIDEDADAGYKLFVSRHDKTLLASGERTLPESVKKRIENL